MAEQTGILGLRGTVGGLTFRKDGSVSQKVASNKASFNSSARMVRVRENASEFGLAGKYGKLLRSALRAAIDAASDRYMTSRLTTKMLEIIKLDDVNDRGLRQYDSTNAAPLLGFDFNAGAGIGQTFFAPYTVTANGADVVLDVPVLNPLVDIKPPQGATHYELVFAATSMDMVMLTSTNAVVAAPLGIQPLNGAVQNKVSSTAAFPVAPPAGELVVGVVGIKFYQFINQKYYPLNNNGTNPLAIEFVA